ncbi:MAG: hypothetical protein NVSMB42_01790 [Herpetosiphon sp.]
MRVVVSVTLMAMVLIACQSSGGTLQPKVGSEATVTAVPAAADVVSAPRSTPSVNTTVPTVDEGRATTRRVAVDQPFPGGPTLLRSGIKLRKVVDVAAGNTTLARSPRSGDLFYLSPAKGIYRVTPTSGAATLAVALLDLFPEGLPAAMTFGSDGSLFVVANRKVGKTLTQAIIRKGTPTDSNRFRWETLATTDPYPLSNTPFDHQFNGVAVSPDGAYLFINSGSRTDHGEEENNGGAFPGTREAALTARIFRLPTAGHDLVLPNDESALATEGRVWARGTRNAYSLAFAPGGDLFAIDNGPDADYPDELNWIREGKHYGFPWRFGVQDNPQQFAGYDPAKDVRLPADYTAVKTGSYHNDPTFPPPPGPFTDPVVNVGPDATIYRGDDGREHAAAAEHASLSTLTAHRSPLGLVFVPDGAMPSDMRGTPDALSALVLSWGAAGGTLGDKGQDLLHLTLRKQGDNYVATTEQIVRGFKNPISSVLVDDRLYVLEFGDHGAIWELTFE